MKKTASPEHDWNECQKRVGIISWAKLKSNAAKPLHQKTTKQNYKIDLGLYLSPPTVSDSWQHFPVS